MSYKFELLEKTDREQWNKRVESSPEGTLFQTTYKAEMCQKTLRQKPFFLLVKKDGEVIAQALILTGFISPKMILSKRLLKLSLPLATTLFNVYSIYYGPLIFDKTNSEEILSKTLYFIDEKFKKMGYIQGNIIPPIHGTERSPKDYRQLFESRGFSAKPSATVWIGLRHDIDELWKNLGPRSRYDVKRTERQGVEIIEAKSKDEILKYHDLRVESAKRAKIRAPLLANTMVGWNMLSPLGKVKIFLAQFKEKVLSGLLISGTNGIIFESGVANSNYTLDKKIRASHLLKWHIIKWAHQNHFRIYDLAGINPNPESRNPKEEGIYQFKSKWGGEIVKFNTYTKVYSPLKIKVIKTFKNILVYR